MEAPANPRRAEDSAPRLLALARVAGKAVLGLLLFGLAAGHLRAQEPDDAPPPPAVDAVPLDATNAAMQVEDLVSALHSLQSDEPPAGEDDATNGAPATATNRSNPGNSTHSYRKPSGRESRSRWSNRQRSKRSGSSSSASDFSQAGALTNTGPASLNFAAFGLIAQRNIFDPNRRPNRPSQPRETPSRDPVFFTLVGTMSYGEGTFAFFSGTGSQYQKALKCSDTIAGYKLNAIGQDAVTLTLDTNKVELRLGMQMRLNEDGTWSPSNPPATYTVSDFQAAPASSASGTAASSGAESEILKRLMEKREKE